jgi:hypothetical protein
LAPASIERKIKIALANGYFTEEGVKEIRSSSEESRDLAKALGVGVRAIQNIRKLRTYKWVV